MTTDVEESEANVHAEFFRELDSCAAALHAFNPDLVVVFGPDHFNGFFYELMPAFCIGTAAEGTKRLAPGRRAAAGAARARAGLHPLPAVARFRRGDLAPDEGRSRHHHSAVQAHRCARPLRRAADLRELRGRSAALVPARARASAKRSASSSPTRTCASRWSARAASRTIRRRRGSTPARPRWRGG